MLSVKFFIALLGVILILPGPLPASQVHVAVMNGDLAAVKSLIENDASVLESRDEAGSTPLSIACSSGNLEMTRYLLEKGADPLAGDNENSGPMHLAAVGGNIEIAKLLLEKGVGIDIRDDNGMTPLLFAGNRRQQAMVDFLIARGADINARSNSVGTLLHAAAYSGNTALIDFLISRGADVNPGLNAYDCTPLTAAVIRNQTEAARKLIDAGADLNPAEENAQHPLTMTIFTDNIPMLDLLMEKGADPNGGKNNVGGPVIAAAIERKTAVLARLLDHGADVNVRTAFGWTPLLAASQGGEPEAVKMLLDRGADLSATDNDGKTALMTAASSGNSDVAGMLAEKSDLSASDTDFGRTALHYAAIHGYADILEILLEAGADIDAEDAGGRTPYYYACLYGNPGCAESLKANKCRTVKCEKNFGRSKHLDGATREGEAFFWYLGHSGWAVKTGKNLLIFDCWENGRKPDRPGLANGFITPEEIAGLDVTVFVTHQHNDHYSKHIFGWAQSVPGIRYVFGFRPADVADSTYIYAAPRGQVTAGDLKISTIESNDTGVGFLVETNGLEIFHAGDHANRNRDMSGPFCGEIDRLAGGFGRIDLAFLPVTGCGFGDQVAVKMGVDYALEKLDPAVMIPMHAGGNSSAYRQIAAELAEKGVKTPVVAVQNNGDRTHYRKGKGLVD